MEFTMNFMNILSIICFYMLGFRKGRNVERDEQAAKRIKNIKHRIVKRK